MNGKGLLVLALIIVAQQEIFCQKNNFSLQCPMRNAIMKDYEGPYKFNQPDMMVVIQSTTDTVARAAINGKVSNVELNNEGTYDVVMYYRDYYMWYGGITKPFVAKGNIVKEGQRLGYIPIGSQLEFLLYKNEQPLDPRKYMVCKMD